MNLHYYFFGLNQERLSIYLTANPRTVEDRNTDTGIQEKKKKKKRGQERRPKKGTKPEREAPAPDPHGKAEAAKPY